MAKQVWKALDLLSPSDVKLANLPRKPGGLHNLKVNSYGQLVKRKGYLKYNTTAIASVSTTVDANSASGQKVLNVTATTGFAENEAIIINRGGARQETGTIDSIQSGTSLTLDDDLTHTHTQSQADAVDNMHKIVGLHRYYKQNTATKKFLVACDENIYYLAETDPWGATSIKSGLTADSDTYFADFLNTCYIVNGVDGVFKYNVTRFGDVGVTKPDAPTITKGGTNGSLGEGIYYFRYTYIDDDGYESNPSDASNAITITSANEHVTVPLSGTTYRKNVYRTSVGGAIYYKDNIDAILSKATVTYESTRADNTLGTEVKTNHTAPESTSHLITKRREKLYLAYNDYLYPSYTSDVEYFPALWAIRIGNSQKITGLLEQLTALPVMTDDSIERLVGTDEDNFEFRNSYSTEGNVAIRSLVNCDNLLVYLGFNGINYFDGVNSGIFSEALNKYIKDNIVDAYRHLSCAAYFDNKYLLCYVKSGTVPNETVWIDLKNKTYGIYSFAFSCFNLWDRGTDGLQLFGGSNTEGRVYKVLNGLEDDGSAITAYDDIEPLDMGYPELWKQFYNIYIKVKSTTGTALTMYYTLDDASEISQSLALTANKTLWYKIDFEGGGQRARAIKPRPYISDKYDFTIMGYAVVFELESPEYA